MAIVTAQAELPKSSPVEPVPLEAAEAPVVEAPKEDAMSSKFAALAKKEKWARKLADDAKKQMEAAVKKEEEYKTNYVDKKRIKENFMDVITEAGLTPDQVANILLNQPNNGQADPNAQLIKEMRAEMAALREELNMTKSGWDEKEKTQYQQAVDQIKADAETLLLGESDAYETLKTRPDAADLITRYIEETHKEEGRVLRVDEAASFIENEILEQALSFAKLKKFQEKAGLISAPKEEPSKPQQNPKQQISPRTLTNAMTPSSNKLSSRDRRARAILAAQGLDPNGVSAS